MENKEFNLYGIIGGFFGDVTPKAFSDFCKTIADGDNVTININSQGGSVFDGFAIMSQIEKLIGRGCKVVAFIDGLCASMATAITSVCSSVEMSRYAMFMIHSPSALTYGNRNAHADAIELLDKMANSIAMVYAEKSGKTQDELIAMMNEEKWMSAEEALALKLIDDIKMPSKKQRNPGAEAAPSINDIVGRLQCARAEYEQLQMAYAQLQSEKQNLEEAYTAVLSVQSAAERERYVDALIAEGRLTPAEREGTLQMLVAQSAISEQAFVAFKNYLEGRPTVALSVQQYHGQTLETESDALLEYASSSSVEMDAAIRTIMKTENCSYSDAAQIIINRL